MLNNPPTTTTTTTTTKKKNHAVYETMWKNVVQHGHATDDSMAYAQYMLDT
jgi:hypothetical protein